MVTHQQLEDITQEICEIFEVYAAPVPIETMLTAPPSELWDDLDVTQLSGSFLSMKERFSPRMSLARLLARHIAGSKWGQQRGLSAILNDEDMISLFARMLIMPADMVHGLTSSARNPRSISLHFEVPESEARQRLIDLV